MNEYRSNSESTGAEALAGKKICIVYDCFFPLTLGGAERWYRELTDELVGHGAQVTYLTRRQWSNEAPVVTGAQIVAVCASSELYDAEGTRRVRPSLAFGFGTFRWLLRHRHEFDAVHIASFPFFSLLGAWSALAGSRTPLFVDFLEVWSFSYWRSYAGNLVGSLGATIQRLCILITQSAQVFVEENAQRLRSAGFHGNIVVLAGLVPEEQVGRVVSSHAPALPVVLFVGRLVKEKGVRDLAQILAEVRALNSTVTMVVVGNGPERQLVEADFSRRGLSEFVRFTGRVSDAELYQLYSEATCTVVPSYREGYGIVVAESAAAGTPVVVSHQPENLAVGLIDSGVNGFISQPSATDVALTIDRVIVAGDDLRRSTAEWYEASVLSKGMAKSALEMATIFLANDQSEKSSG